MTMPLGRHYDSRATNSTQNTNTKMFKWKIFYYVNIVNYAPIIFNEISYVLSTNSHQSLKK